MIRIKDEDAERIVGDKIVWRRDASRDRSDGLGVEIRSVVLTKRDRDGLVDHFGEEWLDEYLAKAVLDLAAWTANGRKTN